MATSWFKHDYNSRDDEKILDLRAEWGWEGYGLFFAFIEKMCENEKGAIDRDRIGGLSIGFGMPKETLIGFINYCIKVGLFFEDEEGMVRNQRATEHVGKMQSFKEAGKKGAEKRWSNKTDRGANSGTNGTPNTDKTRLDKKREDNNNVIHVAGSAFDGEAKIKDVFSKADLSKDPESEKEKYALLAIHIWCDVNNIQPNNQTTLKAKLVNWYDPIRLMVEQDDRTVKEIWSLWQKAHNDNFWKSNVLSTSKLREKFDQLSVKFNSNKKQNTDELIDKLYQ